MMTPSLFDALTGKDQADILEQEGSFICTREENRFLIDLYAIEDFYVEVYFRRHDEGYASISSFYSFENGKAAPARPFYTHPSSAPSFLPVYKMGIKLKGTA